MANRKNGSDDNKNRQQVEYAQVLNELLREPGNKNCADCGSIAPRWASATLGIFLCIKCSGIHRKMGTHISFVRSVGLDDWKEHEIQKMKEMGNTRSNDIWEGRVPAGYPHPQTGDGIALERWIRDKYEAKRFLKKSTEPSQQTVPQNRPTNRNTSPADKRQVPTVSNTNVELLVPHNTEPEFGEFISAPTPTNTGNHLNSTPVITPTTNIKTPPPVQTPPQQPLGIHIDTKSSIMSMFNVPQQPPAPTIAHYPTYYAAVPAQQYYTGYSTVPVNHYYNPQYTHQSDIVNKINSMALEKRQQEFSVLNNM